MLMDAAHGQRGPACYTQIHVQTSESGDIPVHCLLDGSCKIWQIHGQHVPCVSS